MQKMGNPTCTVAAGKRLELIYFMAEINRIEPNNLIKQCKNAIMLNFADAAREAEWIIREINYFMSDETF